MNYSEELLKHFTIQQLESFTENQIRNVSIEGLKGLLRIRESEKKEDERIAKFWKDEYLKLSIDDKVKHWSGGLFRSMRDQEESGLSPYAIYSEMWLRDILQREPEFIEMLPRIYNIWGGIFDSAKVDRIIQRLLKEINR